MKIFKETFEKSRQLREADKDKRIDFTNYTVKEFAEMIDEDASMLQDLMRDCRSCSYVNDTYKAVVDQVKRSKVAEDKREIVSKFIHANIHNNSPHRFYNGRGWGTTVHSNPKSENLQRFNENHNMDSIKSYWAYKEIVEHGYQVEITDNSLTIRFPKPDNDIYAHYTFRYDEDFEDWLVYFHGDNPERKGELIIDDLESISSYERVVKGCLYNFWTTH